MSGEPGGRGGDGSGEDLPPFSRTRYRWFMAYVRWYLRRQFHALRLLAGTAPEIGDEPVLVYTNHPGWWDPLVFLLVADSLYPDRLNYGPIDATALGKYRFLETIGFVGIDSGSRAGARRFLATAAASLRRSDTIYWVTAHGTFVDPRERPVRIRPGVAHAVAAASRGMVVPMAVEYPFWSERFPEAIVAFGEPMRIGDHPGRDTRAWTTELEKALEAAQDRLASAAIARDPGAFSALALGRAGVGGIYDLVRRLGAFARGESFDAAHGRGRS
jgi:1-acyl-sn-glycerol-3-phosphate acyltransferase